MAAGVTVNPMPTAIADAANARSPKRVDFNVSSKGVGLAGSAGFQFSRRQAVAPASQTHVDEPRPVSRALTRTTVDWSDVQIVNYRTTVDI
jgi:hypothetical protein